LEGAAEHPAAIAPRDLNKILAIVLNREREARDGISEDVRIISATEVGRQTRADAEQIRPRHLEISGTLWIVSCR
jgi:hypothetical protein